MNGFKGTQGKWKVDEVGDVMTDEYCVAIVASGDIEDGGEPSKAMMDAILIATAPELLEALQSYMAAVNQMSAAMNDGVNVQGALSALIGSEEMAHAAIAKALGQQPLTGE